MVAFFSTPPAPNLDVISASFAFSVGNVTSVCSGTFKSTASYKSFAC